MARRYSDLPSAVRLPVYGIAGLTFAFLLLPLIVTLPMSVSSSPWFTYPLPGLSSRWFEALAASENWRGSIGNSIMIAVATTILATSFGTAAAIGLANPALPGRKVILALFVAPIIVPVVVIALGIYIFFSQMGLVHTFAGIVIAHTILAVPFVVVTVTASLTRFDFTLVRAARSLGASRLTAFRTVMLPGIAPGVGAGAVFAFATSLDEVVMVLFLAGPEQRTLPRQMFLGLREQLEPTIVAAAVVMIAFTTVLLAAAQYLQRRTA
jgi:putative spermidine/putrescine transport system permease protein